MGQCFSFVLRPGGRKAHFESMQKGSTEGTSATSRSTTGLYPRRANRRRSAGQRLSNATDEYQAEAASGFFSVSDFSRASGSPADGAPTGKEHQTFGRLIAQEAMNEAMRKSTDRLISPEKPSPVCSSKTSGDGHRNSSPAPSPADRKSGEITPVSPDSVADALNIKGRRSLERLRQLTPDEPQNLQKSRSRNERRESKKSLSGPVDFDFLVQKASVDNSKTPSEARRDVERPVERSAPTDRVNGSESVRSSSLSGKDLDDFSKSYKKSAAKAAARDRDAFKYISSSENDFSMTSSVGASPGGRPRRRRHSRSASSYSGPDEEGRESPMPAEMLSKHVGPARKQKAVSSPLPRPAVGLIRNKSSPSIPRGTSPVEAKSAGMSRIRSSPGSLHRAGITAVDAQAQAGQKFAEAPFVSRGGRSSLTRSLSQSRRVGSTIPDR